MPGLRSTGTGQVLQRVRRRTRRKACQRLSTVCGLLQSVSLANRTAGNVLFILVTLPLLVYAVRVWRSFWGLPTWAVFLLLFFSSLVSALVGLAFIFLFGLLFFR